MQSADVSDLSVLSSYKTPRTGVTHVSVAQRRDGLNVLGSQATVNIGRDGQVVFAAGSLFKGLRAGTTQATLGATEAVESAAAALGLDKPNRAAGDASRFGQGARHRADRRWHLGVADRARVHPAGHL